MLLSSDSLSGSSLFMTSSSLISDRGDMDEFFVFLSLLLDVLLDLDLVIVLVLDVERDLEAERDLDEDVE